MRTVSNEEFWKTVRAQLSELESAKNSAEVVRILSKERNPYGDPSMVDGDGFFAGGGGDDTVEEALHTAGWEYVWRKASYYWAMRAPDGSIVTYIEGDTYNGDRLAQQQS